MTGRVQTLRSSVAGSRPTGRQPGELYVNFPDLQLGVVNPANAAQDLIGVTFFSTTSSYVVGQFVIQGGQLYRCVTATGPGVFVPAAWGQIGGSIVVGDNPPANSQPGTLWWDSVGGQLYVLYNDGNSTQWVVANNAASVLASGYLPLSGGTLTGPLSLVGDPTAALQPATKQYVDAGGSGGFVNKLRNGTFDVWQRGTPVSAPINLYNYTADGWIVVATGGGVTVGLSGPSAVGRSYNQLAITGAAGNTAITLTQRIESYVASQMKGGVSLTFQIKCYNATGGTITLGFQVGHANAQDNFSAVAVDVNVPALWSVPANVWTQLAYTFTLPAASLQSGVYVLVSLPALPSGADSVYFAEADLRETPGLPVGLCANPPLPELRPIATELAFCQRYFVAPQIAPQIDGNASAGASLYRLWTAPVALRALPTVNASWSGMANATAGPITCLADRRTVQALFSVTATGFAYGILTLVSLSAEL
jgi:hypothetical protein